VDGRGKIVKEAKVASESEAFVYFFKKRPCRCAADKRDELAAL